MSLEKGVRVLTPKDAISPTGTWSLGARAGDFVFIAGMRGINPGNNRLVDGDEARVRQAFLNMKMIAESEGADFADCVRLTVFVTDMRRLRTSREQGSGRALVRRTIPAADNRRGRGAQPGRLFRGGRHFLLTKKSINLQCLLGWRCLLGYIYPETRRLAPPNRMGFHGHRAIHRQ